jgi:hypothetical protein
MIKPTNLSATNQSYETHRSMVESTHLAIKTQSLKITNRGEVIQMNRIGDGRVFWNFRWMFHE